MASFPLYINVHVDPALAGWEVHIYWRLPTDEPPYTWIGPLVETTGGDGVASFDIGVSGIPEGMPIPVFIGVPQQTYPGPAYYTLGGITYAEYTGPEFEATGYVVYDKNVGLTTLDGMLAEATLTGKALGGFPVPDMTLEFLVNGAPVKEVTYPSVNIGAEYSLAHTVLEPGSQTIKGRMTLENVLKVNQSETEAIDIKILEEVISARVFAANCNLVVSTGQNPYDIVRDQTGELVTRNYSSDILSYLSFNLAGIEGIQSAEFGIYCYEKYSTMAAEALIQTCNPFTCPMEVRQRPSAITTLAQDPLNPPQWFTVSNPALLSYVQSRENDSANFRLFNTYIAVSRHLFSYYTRHGPVGYRPYLDLTYKKFI